MNEQLLTGALFFVFGALFGSFFNNMAFRIVSYFNEKKEGELKLWLKTNDKKVSVCPDCNNKLSFWMNIPIFSWLFLRGKCHYCNSKIPPTYFLTEFLFALSWGVVGYVDFLENKMWLFTGLIGISIIYTVLLTSILSQGKLFIYKTLSIGIILAVVSICLIY